MASRDKARTVVPIAVEVLSFETVLLYSPRQPENQQCFSSVSRIGVTGMPLRARLGVVVEFSLAVCKNCS